MPRWFNWFRNYVQKKRDAEKSVPAASASCCRAPLESQSAGSTKDQWFCNCANSFGPWLRSHLGSKADLIYQREMMLRNLSRLWKHNCKTRFQVHRLSVSNCVSTGLNCPGYKLFWFVACTVSNVNARECLRHYSFIMGFARVFKLLPRRQIQKNTSSQKNRSLGGSNSRPWG